MQDYKEVFRSLDLRDVEGDHIQPTPRWDLHKVYVFIKENIPIEKLRAGLEKIIGAKPNISNVYAIQPILYVLPIELPENISEEFKDAVAHDGLIACAVFIRGATNPFVVSGAKKEAGKLLQKALQKLREKYNEEITWRFQEANDYLDTCKVLVKHDQELARMEYSN